jgi:hypothetical protein
MVAFAMTEENAAHVVRSAMRHNPPPSMYVPHLFACFCTLFALPDGPEMDEFAAKCGFIVLSDVSEISAADSEA